MAATYLTRAGAEKLEQRLKDLKIHETIEVLLPTGSRSYRILSVQPAE
jgi:hypothetical protein